MLVQINVDGKAAKPAIEAGSRLVESLLGGPFRATSALMEDRIYAWQWENRLSIIAKAQEKLKSRILSPESMPPGFLMPLLEGAGSVEEEPLQELWASLLANAIADHRKCQPLFVQTLRSMSSVDAKTYRAWFEYSMANSLHRGFMVEYEEHAVESAIRLEALGILKTSSIYPNTPNNKGIISGLFTLFASSLWEAIEGPVVWAAEEENERKQVELRAQVTKVIESNG